ncbi:MON2-like protein [Elsinoe fawcettii]|nr:MON2-like protein [Elsinoe fawcettii]
MSGQILAIELTAISQEAKRRHADIRTAADKSLQELKSLPSTSEQQLAADLSRRASFIDPFIQGALSKNARLTNSSIVCLQRLIVIKGLPPARLKDVLEGFNASTALSLDIQLKILQALPGLAQNYAEHLTGDLLAAALRVCAALQNVKTSTVSAVAAATLQQLVVSVFDKVAAEDAGARNSSVSTVTQIEHDGSSIPVGQAAFDAYRVLLDIAAATQGERTAFLDLQNFPANVGLELIHAALTSHAGMFASHRELVKVLKDQVVPFLIRLLSDRQGFGITLRAMRIAPLIIQRHVTQMAEECEILLGLLTHLLDPDSSPPWKRTMVMEVFKAIYSTPGLIIQLYMQYDQREGSKAIVRDNISSFVRLSTEKPALIGLGQQSTAPSQPSDESNEEDMAAIEAAGGVAGIISSTVTESAAPGVSSQWSMPKIQVLDLLDKNDAPTIPETYIYSLTLECLNSLSDNLAKIILPLTMSQDGPGKRRSRQQQSGSADDTNGDGKEQNKTSGLQRSRSYRSSTMPINPLTLQKIPAAPKVKAIASLLEDCWPALLATSSTFLYSALDNEYYRGLIRSFQRFTQVSGLLDLITARDAFLTTLGKAAVPPNLTSSLSYIVPQSPGVGSPGSLSKTLLSVNSALSGQTQPVAAGGRRPSHEPASLVLTTRNLLCLRALVNLAIALGPTLKASFSIILGTLQHADLYLDYMQQSGSSASLAPLGHELEAVRSASKRLMESTADYPNDSFKYILDIFCASIDDDVANHSAVQSPVQSRKSSNDFSRRPSSIAAASAESALRTPDRYILLNKTGRLADMNISRFASYPPIDSGWQRLAECLISAAAESSVPRQSRSVAADILCRSAVSLVKVSMDDSTDETAKVQNLALTSLNRLVQDLFDQRIRLSTLDVSIYCRALEAIQTILESSGDQLVTGWDVLLNIVAMTFANDHKISVNGSDSVPLQLTIPGSKSQGANSARTDDVDLVGPEAGRIAFTIIQVICSDFLSSLKPSFTITVSDILHKFARQKAEVNMSLTAITLFSDVSSFLLKDNAKSALESIASPQSDKPPQNIYEDLRRTEKDSRAAQWIILLHQLSEVASDDRNEIRNGAFQMLLRILLDQALDSHAFQFAFKSVLLKALEDNVNRQIAASRLDVNGKTTPTTSADEASSALLEGIAKYLSQNIEVFERTAQFAETWSRMISIMSSFLDLKSHKVNQAVYAALATILAALPIAKGKWPSAVGQVGSLWGSSFPVSTRQTDQTAQQEAFLAYVECAAELARLTSSEATSSQIQSIAKNALRCVQESMPEKYGSDENNATRLQSATLDLLKSLRSDIEGASPILVTIAAEMIRLPFHEHEQTSEIKTKRPTFVALAKEAMDWMVKLYDKHSDSPALCTSPAAIESLSSLTVPFNIKYHFSKSGRDPPPWKRATTSALAILPIILFHTSSIQSSHQTDLWTTIINLASAIIHGDYTPLPIPSSFAAITQVETDEHFDATSLLTLRSIMLPRLGSSSIPTSVREIYCQSLFSASIIHPLRPSHSHLLSPAALSNPLRDLHLPVKPRVHDPEPSRREDLAYLCLAELISMASSSPRGFEWGETSTFTSPYEPGMYGEEGSEEKRNLAGAAVPWLLARVGVLVGGYVADQPLREAGWVPISLREEMGWVLGRVGEVRVGVDVALSGDGGEQEDGRLGGGGEQGREKVDSLGHIRALHPLLVKAIGVAGNGRHGNEEILRALMGVLDVYGRGA